MPFPVGVPIVVVTKNYRDAQGNVPVTRTMFRPSVRKILTAQDVTIEPISVSASADPTTGVMSVTLAATDGFTYEVSELVSGIRRKAFSIAVPAGGGPYQLDELAPVQPEVPGYVPVRTVEGIEPDPQGNIDLPPSAGSDPAGTAAGLMTTHEGALDPHPVYSTALTNGLAAKENVGVAAGLVNAHAAAVNPHPVYLTQAEADALYAAIGALAVKQNVLVSRQARLVAGNINLNVAAGAAVWEVLPGSPTLTIPATAGDTVGVSATIGRQANANLLMDIGVVVGGVIQRWLGNGAIAAAPAAPYEGDIGLYHTNIPVITGERRFQVAAGDLTGANVELKILRKINGAGSALVLMDTTNPGYWQATNYGVVA
jgi:hypothetical protein